VILVAFVLVLVAAASLIVGVFLPPPANSMPFIWTAIVACVATFGVLGASFVARRRATGGPAARPSPLGVTDEARPAPSRMSDAPRGRSIADPAEIAATAALAETRTTPVAAPSPVADASAHEAAAIAPRRVVRRAPAPLAETASLEVVAVPTAAASTPVVRRVVRRVATNPDAVQPATRTVVRRPQVVQPAGVPTKVVRRVVARSAGEAAATTRAPVARVTAAESTKPVSAVQPTKRATPTGTRGAKARTELSQIKGVGPAKQDALLKMFGSLEAMADASVDELTTVKGVGAAVATELKKVLQAR
jgi:predicted flap endonuclease-1-like 5' DNA nuclease